MENIEKKIAGRKYFLARNLGLRHAHLSRFDPTNSQKPTNLNSAAIDKIFQ
jgi:hypothetical protein